MHAAQSPRVKRTHKKSRKGCSTCKQRRIKCDEGRPLCHNCERRGIECTYGLASATSFNQTRQKAVESPSPAVVFPCVDDPACMQTELLRHYLQHASNTFAALSLRSQEFWRTVVPALAYTSTPVRLGMLTLSALCLANDTALLDPEQSEAYVDVAEYHGLQFINICSQEAETLGQGDRGLQLTCSRLLAILALAWYRVRRDRGEVHLVDPEAWTWLHMLRGSATLHHHSSSPRSGVSDELASELAAEGSSGASDSYRRHPGFELFAKSRKVRFEALYHAASVRRPLSGEETANDIVAAIDDLQSMTEELCSDSNELSWVRTLCFWPCKVTKGFADLLIRGNALALAVYAHWLMPMALVQDAWFIEGMGVTGINEIYEMLGSVQDTGMERSLLDLPRRIVSRSREVTASPGDHQLWHTRKYP